MRVSATEAKNRFGSLCAQAKREPAFIEKAGQLHTVILSAEHDHALQAKHDKAILNFGRGAAGVGRRKIGILAPYPKKNQSLAERS